MKTYKLEITIEVDDNEFESKDDILKYLDFQCNRGEGYFYFTDSAKLNLIKEIKN